MCVNVLGFLFFEFTNYLFIRESYKSIPHNKLKLKENVTNLDLKVVYWKVCQTKTLINWLFKL